MKLNDTFTEVPSVNDTKTVTPVWDYGYSSRDAYDPHGEWPADAPLNATFWHNVAEKIRDDSTYRQLYLDYSYRRSPYVPTCEDDKCIQKLYCYVTSFTVPQALECMQNKHNASSPSFVAWLSLFILSTVVRIVLGSVLLVAGLAVFAYFRYAKNGYQRVDNGPNNRSDYLSVK